MQDGVPDSVALVAGQCPQRCARRRTWGGRSRAARLDDLRDGLENTLQKDILRAPEVLRDPFKHPLSLRRARSDCFLQGGGVMLQRFDLRAAQIPVADWRDGGLYGAMPALLPAAQKEIQ